jgi:multidrug resistance protein MdtO
MATLVSEADRGSSFIAFLARELAPREGRGVAVAHIAAATTLTVAIAMVFRIPLAAYMAYLVFLVSRDDRAATITAAVGGTVAVTLAIVLTIGLSLIDLGDPAIRLPTMALVTFLAMFSVRTFALGPVSFLAGFIVVTLQSVIDEVPNTETFTRTALWLWVVVVVPVAITILINLLFGAGSQTVAARGFREVLGELDHALAEGETLRKLSQWRATLQPLIEKAQGAAQGTGGAIVSPAAIGQLLDVLVILEQYPDPIPARERDRLSTQVGQCLRTLDRPEGSDGAVVNVEAPAMRVAGDDAEFPAAVAAHDALRGLEHEIDLSRAQPGGHAAHQHGPMIVPDALSNPAHWQFALKTTLAVMIVYAVYSMLDWPGLRTSIVTCFFVALGSLGETVHKLSLRLSGAIIGGLLAGLSIVFVLPHLTDIGQLSILTAVVALIAGWVATSSERLAYAGLQIAFAFFLGVLQTDAPATDLTVLRDRVVGIVLGNVVITLVFSTLWPESALTRLRVALADAQRAIAALLRSPAERSAARRRAVAALTRADEFATLSQFELTMLPGQIPPNAHLPGLHSVERLAAAAFIITSDPISQGVDAGTTLQLADWLDAAGRATAEQQAVPTPPSATTPGEPATGLVQVLARLATAQLRTEIARVAATAP